MNRVKLVVASVLVVLLVILMIQNRNPVETRLLFATVTMAQSLLLLVTAVLSFAAGGLVTWFLLRRRKGKASPVSNA